MIILIMGLNDRELAASGVVSVFTVVVVIVSVLVGPLVVVSVYAVSHAEISPPYFSNQARFASTVALAALAVARADPNCVSY
jgi:hypothetical protein